jgi:hypothetical protein
MYIVVFRARQGNHIGVVTWTSFSSKEAFDLWHDAEMRDWYDVVAEGVSSDKAVELCSSPESTQAVIAAGHREIGGILEQVLKQI